MHDIDRQIGIKYLPYLLINQKEPFLPKEIGLSIFRETQNSKSFQRQIIIDQTKISYVIEYAIYWNYDIEHLFDLEHIWIYIGKDNEIVDCEVSFHGRYIKGLKKDGSNKIGNHVLLYCQAGKHAFSPYSEVFHVLPNYIEAVTKATNDIGLLVTPILENRILPTETLQQKIKNKLKHCKFIPSDTYYVYTIKEEILTSWELLYRNIYNYIIEEINNIL